MIELGEETENAIDNFDFEHEISEIILLGKDNAIRRIILYEDNRVEIR